MNLSLRASTDIVVGWIGRLQHELDTDRDRGTTHLFHEEQSDAFKHLIAIERGYGHVEEETIEHGSWDVSQRVRDEEDRQTDENVRHDPRETGLTHFHDSIRQQQESVRVTHKHCESYISYTCPWSTRSSTSARLRTCKGEWGSTPCIQGKPYMDRNPLSMPTTNKSR